MTYSTSMLDKKVTVLNPSAPTDGEFGRNSSGVTYSPGGCPCASVTWNRGVKALREGALDAYDIIMVRLRYDDGMACGLSRESRLEICGTTYIIQSYNADQRANTIQITATEMTV